MAENIIYTLEIKGTEQELKRLAEINKNIDTLKTEIKELNEVDAKAAEQKKAQLKQEQEGYRKLQTELRTRNKAEKEGVDTLEKMRAKLSNMNKELDRTQIGSKRFKQLTADSKALRDQIKTADEATGRFQANVGNYKGAIMDAFRQMGVNVGGVTQAVSLLGGATTTATYGINGLSGAFKLLKVAVASTGIGLLVVGLASLVSYFNSTEEGAAKLQKILSPFKILFGNLTDKMNDFGEAIVGAFENPKQAISDLWEAIKANFVNRINGVIKVAKSLGTVLEGVWELDRGKIETGFKDAGRAMLDVVTGVEDAATKATDYVGDFIKEIAKETREENEKNLQVIDRQLALDKRRRAFLTEEAKIQTEIAEQRLIANDRSKTAEERQAAINNAIALNTTLAEKRKAIEEEDLALMELRASFSDSDAETLNAIEQKKADIIRLQKTENDQAREMVSLRSTINNQIEQQKIKTQEAINAGLAVPEMSEKDQANLDEWKKKYEEVQSYITEKDKTELEKRHEQLKYWQEQGYITEEQFSQLRKELKVDEFNNQISLAGEALGQLSDIAGKETAVGKASAVAQSIINTYLGVSKSLSMGMPIGGIMAALTLAAGLANVQKILSVDTNINKKFATGVIGLQGAGSETSDSIPARLSRGESVMTAKATRAFAPVLADMERAVGNIPNYDGSRHRFATGLIAAPKTDFTTQTDRIISRTISAIGDIPVVVAEGDISTTQERVRKIKVSGDL